MAIGTQYTVKFHEDDDGEPVIDSILIKTFTHVAGFVETSGVTKEDFTGSVNDSFTVKFMYPEGSEPALSISVADWLADAQDAVNTEFGDGEAGDPTS